MSQVNGIGFEATKEENRYLNESGDCYLNGEISYASDLKTS